MLNLAAVLAITLITAQAKHTHARPFEGQPPNPSTAMSGPYQTLFRIEPPRGSGTVQVPVAEPKTTHARVIEMGPRVERGGCNMPIIVARPEVDRKIIVTPPDSAKKAAKIRAIEPPLCGDK